MSVPDEAARGPLTLALDAATYVGTVAVLAGPEVLAEAEVAMRGEREERLMPAVATALRDAGAAVGDLARVVCGAGPGSFTSLRIAGSIAKGIAVGRGVPLFSISSLWLTAAGARAALGAGEYLAVLDAMRGEWFGAPLAVLADGQIVERGAWSLFSAAELEERVRQGGMVIGPGAFGEHRPRARGVAAAGPAALSLADLDTWEPDYGRKAEAQVRWEATHGRPLAAG